MLRDVHVLHDRSFSAGDRLAAVIRLEMALKDTPNKTLLVQALRKRANADYSNILDMIMNEMFITGEQIFTWYVLFDKASSNRMKIWVTQ